ncbi:DUF4145 domain-containing protein [Mycolicibacterium porcinum]
MAMRTCGFCGLRRAQMIVVKKDHQSARSEGGLRTHTILACPDCAGLTVVETNGTVNPGTKNQILRVYPDADDATHGIRHLPNDVKQYFEGARRVLDAGVPDAAAVQLRKTLEAAAAHFGVSERNLMRSIERLIEDGLVTRQFGSALHHIRAVGNAGAHATDERVDDTKALQALGFTIQLLRNLFEVPGDLREIAGDESSGDNSDGPAQETA